MLKEYSSFGDLAAAHVEGRDFVRIVRRVVGSRIAIVAPHGGRIEPQTDIIAQNLAGSCFSCYTFRALLPKKIANLHITSHRFDDPACLRLIASHKFVLAIHGWARDGESLLVGGRDTVLGRAIIDVARALRIDVSLDAGNLGGMHRMNICNRGSSGRGVQLELARGLRRSQKLAPLIADIHRILLHRHELVIPPS